MAGSRSSCQYSQKLQPDSRLSDVVRGFPRIPSTAGRKMNRESPMPKSASKATQQNFLKAVAKKMFTAGNIATKIDDYARIFNQYVETDLTLGNLVWLGTEVLKMGVDKIDFSTLPNEWHSPYIYLDPTETLTVVNTYLNPYVEDRTVEDLNLPS